MLVLPIKKKWFDMILSGEKKEEYREIKPYWMTRFKNVFQMYPYSYIPEEDDVQEVIFRNGYSSKAPTFKARCHLKLGKGKEEWGADPGKEYYILVIEEIVWKNTGCNNYCANTLPVAKEEIKIEK